MHGFMLRLVAFSFLFATVSNAEDATAKAKAALALAQAKRERESDKAQAKGPAAGVQEGCFTDLATARSVAKRTGKPLVLWVGMECRDAKDVCDSLAGDVVSCHLAEYHGSKTPRVVVPDKDGTEYRILKTDIDSTTPIGIRKRMNLPIKAEIIESYLKQLTKPIIATAVFAPSYMPSISNCST